MALIACGPAHVERGRNVESAFDPVLASIHLDRGAGVAVMLELADETQVLLVMPPEALNWDAVLQAGRAAA